jgi:hypothetical protein
MADGLSARAGAEIQITELRIDAARWQGGQVQSSPQTRLTRLAARHSALLRR